MNASTLLPLILEKTFRFFLLTKFVKQFEVYIFYLDKNGFLSFESNCQFKNWRSADSAW